MIPNFALSLSFDGIRLLHRGSRGWHLVGEAKIDAPDLDRALAVLRKTALDLDPAGLRCKIILPNDQIKYISLDTGRAQEDDVQAALDGATPYAVDELVYDFVRGGGRTHIAAVARETLDEAEAFATEHRFAPVSFVAVPEPFTFVGEPFFGPTRAAAGLLGKGDEVTRDAEPVVLAQGNRQASAVISAATETAELTAPDVMAEPVPEASTTPVPTANGTAPDEIAASSSADDAAAQETPAPDLLSEPIPEPEPEPEPEPKAATSRKSLPPGQSKAGTQPVDLPPLEDTPPPEDLPPPQDLPPLEDPSLPGDIPPAEELPPPEELSPPEPVFSSRMAQRSRRPDVITPSPAAATNAAQTSLPPSAGLSSRPSAGAVEPVPPRRTPPPAPPRAPTAGPAAPRPSSVPPLMPPDAGPEVVPGRKMPGIAGAGPSAAAPLAAPALPAARRAEPVPPRRPAASLASSAMPTGPARPIEPASPAPATNAVPRFPVPPAAEASVPVPSIPVARQVIPDDLGSNGFSEDATFPLPSGRPSAGPPAALSAALTKQVPPKAGRFGSRRAKRSEEQTSLPVGRAQNEKERLTVFGARASQAASRGTPKYLGLILTAVLILLMAGVAAFAALSPSLLAGLFGGNDTVEASATLPDAQDASPLAPSVAPTAPLASAESGAFDPPSVEGAVETAPPLQLQPVATPDVAPVAPPGSDALPVSDTPLVAEGESLLPDPDVLAAVAAPTPAAAVAVGTVLSPAAAERFYAATGVWLRAPRLPLLPQSETLQQVALIDPDSDLATRLSPVLPPANVLGPDAALGPQPDPPDPDLAFPRDSRGYFLATPEGTVTPYGMLIFAGQPPVVPPARPGTVAPDVVGTPDALAPDALAPDALAPDAPDALAEAEAPDTAVDPGAASATAGAVSLAGLRPPVRPEDLAPVVPAIGPQADPEPSAAPLVAFDGTRPEVRPDNIAPVFAPTAEPEVPTAPLVQFDGPRPTARPGDIVPAASGQADVEAVLASVVEATPDPFETATELAVAEALRPDPRPQNFARVVEQANARNARAQPAAAAGIAPTALAPTAPEATGPAPEDDGEPEIAAAVVVPNGPIPGGVATAATIDNAINLRNINLIGVYGRPSDRHALVRLGNGRYVRVGVGDSLDGGQVAAIYDNSLNYVKRGRTYSLEIPSG